MSSLYLHIPYCKTRCGYCDFHSSTCTSQLDEYVNALCQELTQRQHFLPNNQLQTIYFGGGTPSLLSQQQLKQIFKSIQKHYSIDINAEITLEANPDDLSREKLLQFYEIGINRLSIGIQSFDNDDLERIGRRHTALQAIKAIHTAQNIGFSNISADLIFGLPFQTLDKWKKNLNQLFGLNIQHISCYNLTYEEGTAFYKNLQQGNYSEIGEDLQLEMYRQLIEQAKQKDFIHYEISNFGKESYFSQHNSNYWRNIPYLGVGAGAHSFDGKSRRWNISNNQKYINGIVQNTPNYENESINKTTAYNEFIMTGLRTIWGCNLDILKQRFGETALQFCLDSASPYINKEQLIIQENTLSISPNAIFISDQIMSDLMQA